jgi:hypothetical protein
MGVGPNFNDVRLADGGTTLVVVGKSTRAPGREVRVVIHAADDVHKRLEGRVPTPIHMSWEATLDQTPDAPFAQGDTVVVVGREISKEGKSFMWANQLNIT